MRSQGRNAVVALLAFAAYGSAAIALAGELQHMHASVSNVTIQIACEATPSPSRPGSTPNACRDSSTITVNYAGHGCTSDDFVVKVRDRLNVQLATIFKRKSATSCHVTDESFATALESVDVLTNQISYGRPLKFTNLIPVRTY